jgi:hypothetical protein
MIQMRRLRRLKPKVLKISKEVENLPAPSKMLRATNPLI